MEDDFCVELAKQGLWEKDDNGLAKGKLGWDIATNLRWLSYQNIHPDQVPLGMSTGSFLQAAAEGFEKAVVELDNCLNPTPPYPNAPLPSDLIRDANILPRIKDILRSNGYITVSDLDTLSRSRYLRLFGAGKKNLEALEAWLGRPLLATPLPEIQKENFSLRMVRLIERYKNN